MASRLTRLNRLPEAAAAVLETKNSAKHPSMVAAATYRTGTCSGVPTSHGHGRGSAGHTLAIEAVRHEVNSDVAFKESVQAGCSNLRMAVEEGDGAAEPARKVPAVEAMCAQETCTTIAFAGEVD